jgi:hypothetical protein
MVRGVKQALKDNPIKINEGSHVLENWTTRSAREDLRRIELATLSAFYLFYLRFGVSFMYCVLLFQCCVLIVYFRWCFGLSHSLWIAGILLEYSNRMRLCNSARRGEMG